MSDTRKEVGDKWGWLVGLAVDACKSHHASHSCEETAPDVLEHKTSPEITDCVVTASQNCAPSWTDTPGQTMVAVEAVVAMVFSDTGMCLLRPGEELSTQPEHGAPYPQQVSKGTTDVVIAIDPQLPRGLYVGRLNSATGGGPDEPILIYLDEVTY